MSKRQFYWDCIKHAATSKTGALAGIVTVILAAIAYNQAPLEGAMNILLWAIPLAVFVITLILAPYHLYRDKEKEQNILSEKLHAVENAHPNITLVRTENILGDVITRSAGKIVSHERPYFTRIQTANDPKSSVQAVNAKIAAHITFYDGSWNKCFPTMIGRWAETTEIAQGGSTN